MKPIRLIALALIVAVVVVIGGAPRDSNVAAARPAA
jgi:hypothetical protein